jgi:hypothetical protein
LGRFEIEGGEKFSHFKKIKFPWLIAKSYYSKAYKSKSVGRILLNSSQFYPQKNIFLIFQKKLFNIILPKKNSNKEIWDSSSFIVSSHQKQKAS